MTNQLTNRDLDAQGRFTGYYQTRARYVAPAAPDPTLVNLRIP